MQEFNSRIAVLVSEVSDDQILSKEERRRQQIYDAEYISNDAKLIRLADKIANVQSINLRPPRWTDEAIREYLRFASRVVNQLRGTNAALEAEFDRAISVCRV